VRGDHYETLAICRLLEAARAAFAAAVAEKPAGRFMIRARIRVVKRHRVAGKDRLMPALVITAMRRPR